MSVIKKKVEERFNAWGWLPSWVVSRWTQLGIEPTRASQPGNPKRSYEVADFTGAAQLDVGVADTKEGVVHIRFDDGVRAETFTPRRRNVELVIASEHSAFAVAKALIIAGAELVDLLYDGLGNGVTIRGFRELARLVRFTIQLEDRWPGAELSPGDSSSLQDNNARRWSDLSTGLEEAIRAAADRAEAMVSARKAELEARLGSGDIPF